MMLETLQAIRIAPWKPTIAISSQVSDPLAIDSFIARVRAGYTAPGVDFQAPEALTVMGHHFAVITERGGLWPGSIHTIGKFKWHQAFARVRNVRLLHECSVPPLIAANSGYQTYYHWTAETVGALLIHQLFWPESTAAAVIPTITTPWQREALDLFDLPYEFIEIAPTEAAVFDQAVLTNLTARDFGIYPHPGIAQEFRNRLPVGSMQPANGALIYVSRQDALDRRPMINEEDLCKALSRLGFEVIVPGTMSVKAQAAAFAHAKLIVAPHGAALANLHYSGEGKQGPAIIELQQEGYLSAGYAKLSQAKSLDYSAIVNPCTDRGEYHHHSRWMADIELIEQVVARKLGEIGTGA